MVAIPVEQWCLRVDRKRGEETRQRLLRENALDRRLKIRAEGDILIFPVINPGAKRDRSSFEELEFPKSLPRHELIGGIAIMLDRDPAGAKELLSSRPSLHTVLFPLSAVEGTYRVRRFEVLAGRETTRTEYVEYGLHFTIDLSIAYFSARLSGERQRILSLMGAEERVLDMFSGIGPFAITLATKANFVIAVDMNPEAITLMIENIVKNRCMTVVPMLADAAHLGRIIDAPFDRVIMNLPMESSHFLEIAFTLCRPGGTVHLYVMESSWGSYLPLLSKYPVANIEERQIRSYSPTQYHAVYDIDVAERRGKKNGFQAATNFVP